MRRFPIGHLAKEDGFTLVEFIISFSLMSLVAGVVFGFYFLGAEAFRSVSAQVDLQQNVRIAADTIARELRFAPEAEVKQNGLAVEYARPNDQRRFTIKKKGSEIVLLTGNVENKIAYHIAALELTLDRERRILEYRIEGLDGEHSYALQSAVRLRNLQETAQGE